MPPGVNRQGGQDFGTGGGGGGPRRQGWGVVIGGVPTSGAGQLPWLVASDSCLYTC